MLQLANQADNAARGSMQLIAVFAPQRGLANRWRVRIGAREAQAPNPNTRSPAIDSFLPRWRFEAKFLQSSNSQSFARDGFESKSTQPGRWNNFSSVQ